MAHTQTAGQANRIITGLRQCVTEPGTGESFANSLGRTSSTVR